MNELGVWGEKKEEAQTLFSQGQLEAVMLALSPQLLFSPFK